GCWPGSTGWDWLPTRLRRKVSEAVVTSHPPFPSFSWRNTKEVDRAVNSARGDRETSRWNGKSRSRIVAGSGPAYIRGSRLRVAVTVHRVVLRARQLTWSQEIAMTSLVAR